METALPDSIADVPANPANPADPDVLAEEDDNDSPAPDVEINRGLDMPDIIESGQAVDPAATSAEEPAPANAVLRFEDGTTITLFQAGVVQGEVLMTSLQTIDGVDESRDYVFVRMSVTGTDAEPSATVTLTGDNEGELEMNPVEVTEGDDQYSFLSNSIITDGTFPQAVRIEVNGQVAYISM